MTDTIFTCPICGQAGHLTKDKPVRLTLELGTQRFVKYWVHMKCVYGMILEQHRNASIWKEIERYV